MVIDPIVFVGTAVMDKDGEYKIAYFLPMSDDSYVHMRNVEKMVKLVDERAPISASM